MKNKALLILAVPLMLASCGSNTPYTSGTTSTSTPGSQSTEPSTPGSTSTPTSTSTSTSQSVPETDQQIIKKISDGYKAFENSTQGKIVTDVNSYTSDVTDYTREVLAYNVVNTTTFKDAAAYAKSVSTSYTSETPSVSTGYNLVKEKDSKNIYSNFMKNASSRVSHEVDEYYAKDASMSSIKDAKEAIETLAYFNDFASFGDYLGINTASSFGLTDVTKDDYVVSKEITEPESGTKKVVLNLKYNDAWCSTHLIYGQQLAKFSCQLSYSYNSSLLYEINQISEMGFQVAANAVMLQKQTQKVTLSTAFDETFKTEIEAADSEGPAYPETINKMSSSIQFYVNGDNNVQTTYISDYTYTNTVKATIGAVCFTDAHSIKNLFSSIASQVNFKYEFTGADSKEFTEENISTLEFPIKAYGSENKVQVSAAPKDENKCVVIYEYVKNTYVSEYSYDTEIAYLPVVVDKSTAYTLQTEYNGDNYVDEIRSDSLDFTYLTGKTTVDISNTDTLFIHCVKKVPYEPYKVTEEEFASALTTGINNVQMSSTFSDNTIVYDINDNKAQSYETHAVYYEQADTILYRYDYDDLSGQYEKTDVTGTDTFPTDVIKSFASIYSQTSYDDQTNKYVALNPTGYSGVTKVTFSFENKKIVSIVVTTSTGEFTYTFTNHGAVQPIELPEIVE